MGFIGMILTESGRSLMASAISEDNPLKITHIQMGDGIYVLRILPTIVIVAEHTVSDNSNFPEIKALRRLLAVKITIDHDFPAVSFNRFYRELHNHL